MGLGQEWTLGRMDLSVRIRIKGRINKLKETFALLLKTAMSFAFAAVFGGSTFFTPSLQIHLSYPNRIRVAFI